MNPSTASVAPGPAAGSAPAGAPPRRPLAGFDAPTRWTAVVVVVMAVAFDVAVHHPVASVASASLVLVTLAGLLAGGRVRNRQALVLVGAAAVVACFLALRASPWLVALDVAAALGLTVLAAGYAAGGSLRSLTASTLVVQGARAIVALCLAPAFALGCASTWIPARTDEARDRLRSVARGVGLALPVVIVLALLLASADAVFASVFAVPDDLGSLARHVAVVGVGIVVASALFVASTGPAAEARAVAVTPFGATETTVVLASIALLYGAFAAAQVVAATGGADHVLETSGLTYADYARSGFFQLLAVAALTLAVVLGLRVTTRREARSRQVVVAALGELVVALTLVIVGVAVKRLGLYDEAFGSTMLRLASTVFAWWLGAVFVLVALALAGVGARTRWLTAAVAATGVVVLVGWNVVNPEQLVVERNLARAQQGAELDTDYLWHLSDDAVPVLAAALPTLGPGTQGDVLARVCLVPAPPGSATAAVAPDERGGRLRSLGGLAPGAGAPGGPEVDRGLGANRSATQAAEARARVCR